MGKQSSLGPIDPQINGLPASGIVAEFYQANREIKKDRGMMNVWGPVISRYPPSLIDSCKKAIAWSREVAHHYLSISMFNDELRENRQDTENRIDSIIRLLTDQELTKSHARHIPTPVCKRRGLKIVNIEDDDELQDVILSIHHAAALTIMRRPAIKIIENQNGKAYVTGYSGPPT